MKRQIVAFHGGPAAITEFQAPEHGCWFSSSQWVAEHYARGGVMHEVILSFTHALSADAHGSSFDEVEYTAAMQKLAATHGIEPPLNHPDPANPKYTTIDADSLAKLAKASGCDGLIIENVYESATDEVATEFVIFDGAQVKLIAATQMRISSKGPQP